MLQVDDDDSFGVAVAVALEEIAKQRAQRVCGRVGGKQLASVLCLLRATPRVEGQKHFIDDVEVNPIQVPTGIEVARILLGRNEAAIDEGALAAGGKLLIDRALVITAPFS